MRLAFFVSSLVITLAMVFTTVVFSFKLNLKPVTSFPAQVKFANFTPVLTRLEPLNTKINPIEIKNLYADTAIKSTFSSAANFKSEQVKSKDYFHPLAQNKQELTKQADESFSESEAPVLLPRLVPQIPEFVPLPKINGDTWRMPFRSGTRIQVHQGYFGQFSHQGKFALDFPDSNHLDIIAARAGTVIKIANGQKWDQWCNSWKNCNNKDQIWSGNHIYIRHDDGTVAKYLHFNPGSISPTINIGARVNQGDFLGQMGSTGYTCLTPACTEPDNHLHFEVQNGYNTDTIPTPFLECVNRANICDSNGWFIQGSYYISD